MLPVSFHCFAELVIVTVYWCCCLCLSPGCVCWYHQHEHKHDDLVYAISYTTVTTRTSCVPSFDKSVDVTLLWWMLDSGCGVMISYQLIHTSTYTHAHSHKHTRPVQRSEHYKMRNYSSCFSDSPCNDTHCLYTGFTREVDCTVGTAYSARAALLLVYLVGWLVATAAGELTK